ncbi:MAG: acylneuraminate cytidylyltransferase family protein [Hyphomonadaceae bacterium]
MKNGKRVTALLPIKAHSARVASKNFRMIAGKPLFRWVLDTLAESSEIDQIIINTDAREILMESGLNTGDYGGKVLIRNRRPEICGDMVSMNLVLEDDVKAVPSDYYIMTHTTNPLLRAATVSGMLDAYVGSSEYDSLFAVNKHQTRFYKPSGEPINHDPENLLRTQDLPPYMEENSVFYIFTAESFALTGARIGGRPQMYVTPVLESVDIDEPSDWFIAESLLLRIAAGETLPES